MSSSPAMATARAPIAEPPPARLAARSAKPKSKSNTITAVFAGLVVAALIVGWIRRGEHLITPESGIGYTLGIVGTALMLLLLTYPLRKRLRFMHDWGRVPSWLKSHMVLGILGPTLILFHANFELGATNSTVALMTMLVVVASGIVGRYIYSKTHNRFSGEVRSLRELRSEADEARQGFKLDLPEAVELRAALKDLEARVLDGGRDVVSSSGHFLSLGWSKGAYRRRLRRMLKSAVRNAGLARGWDSRTEQAEVRQGEAYLAEYIERLHRITEFRLYERLFALWHVLHVPLLFLLIFATVVHVIAVHLY